MNVLCAFSRKYHILSVQTVSCFNFRAAKDYVMHVLFKEAINYLAMEHLGLPYQLADERGRSTEVSKIEELKKVITDNYLYN